MKRINKMFLTLLIIAMMIAGMTVTAFADGTVTYKGEPEKFVFAPGTGGSPSNLFEKFDDLMPGDELNEKVTIANESGKTDYINVYLRAVAHDEENNPLESQAADSETVESMNEFLSKLSMTVVNKADGKIIFEASPEQTAGLTNDVLLGKLYKGESLELDVTLNMPIELDNKYAGRMGEIDWVFTVAELNENSHMTLTKTVTSKPANGKAYTEGEKITYEIKAKNDGNVDMMNVVIKDDLTGDSWNIDLFAAGEEKTFTTSYIVTKADVKAGSVKNTVTASGENDNPDIPEPNIVPGTAEVPTAEKPSKPTDTGDSMHMMYWVAIFAFAAIVVVLLKALRRKANDK